MGDKSKSSRSNQAKKSKKAPPPGNRPHEQRAREAELKAPLK